MNENDNYIDEETAKANQILDNRFGFYKEKTTEELEEVLEKLVDECEKDYKTFNSTNNSNEKLDVHNDIKFEEEQIDYIEKLLRERKGSSR